MKQLVLALVVMLSIAACGDDNTEPDISFRPELTQTTRITDTRPCDDQDLADFEGLAEAGSLYMEASSIAMDDAVRTNSVAGYALLGERLYEIADGMYEVADIAASMDVGPALRRVQRDFIAWTTEIAQALETAALGADTFDPNLVERGVSMLERTNAKHAGIIDDLIAACS